MTIHSVTRTVRHSKPAVIKACPSQQHPGTAMMTVTIGKVEHIFDTGYTFRNFAQAFNDAKAHGSRIIIRPSVEHHMNN